MDKTLISIIGGLGAMFGWGTSDFFANNSSEKLGHLRTLFWSQCAGLLVMVGLILFLPTKFELSLQIIGLIIVAGIGYALGYLLFYKGFELGNVSVISAVVGIQNVFIILISFFVFQQTLTPLQIPALLLLLTGVTLVSVNLSELTSGKVSLKAGVKETLLSTVMFGVIFWPFNEFISEQVDWKLSSLMIKLVAIIFVFLYAMFAKKALSISSQTQKVKLVTALVGVLEAIAIISMSFGLAYGDGIIVAPISSSLTIVTVALAMMFSKEKITKLQALGILMAVGGIILTAF